MEHPNPQSSRNKRVLRQVWMEEEDKFLIERVKQDGLKKWSAIADALQVQFKNPNKRTGKQCRTRWLNHLDPSINKGP